MLLQLEHEHKGKEQPSSPQKQEQIANSRITKKPEPVQQAQSIFFVPQVYQETSSFNFHTDGLEEILKFSKGDLPPFVVEYIKERKHFSEERVYQAIVQTSADFVGIHMRDFKAGLKQEMQSMFESIHNTVEAGIWDGRYEINESRNKYFSIARKENQLVSFVTGELVKRNLQSFRQELDDDQMGGSTVDAAYSYHAKSENYKTKVAEDFVKKMRDEQIRHQSQLNRQLQAIKIKEFKTIEERKAQEERRRTQKKQLVRKRIEKQNELWGIEKQRRQKIHSQYLKMVSSNRKHLYQQTEERYNKSVMEEQKRKFKMMKELKEQRRPISFEEIQQHMAKYEQLLQENQSFRQQKRELKESEYEIIASKRPYRSKFYSLTLKQGAKTDDEKQLKTSLIKKQVDYAEHVKRNFMPKTDQSKQQELQELIKRIGSHKKQTYHSRKYMQEGKRNLEKLHLLIAELRAKNKLKENIGIQQLMMKQQKQPLSKRYKNYLQEIKQTRGDSEQKIDFQNKISNKSHDQIKMISLQKQQRAKQRQKYLNSSIESVDIHQHMQGKLKVEQDFLQAAKAKMAILKKYNLDANAQKKAEQQS